MRDKNMNHNAELLSVIASLDAEACRLLLVAAKSMLPLPKPVHAPVTLTLVACAGRQSNANIVSQGVENVALLVGR